MSDDRLLLRVHEAAERLGVSRAKFYELIARGAVRTVKIDGSRRVRVADLRDFVQQLPEQPA